MSQQNPPIILVKTWLQLLQSDMEPEFKRQVEHRIINIFGTLQLVYDYSVSKQ